MSLTDTIAECWDSLSAPAQDHIRRTRPTLLNQWALCEDGYHYDTITAEEANEALDAARDGVERSNYRDACGTIWIDVRIANIVTGETWTATVTLEPDVPACADDHEHDWQSPYSVLGGLEENPGVQGHGGGVIIREVCTHCGTYRVTDTWAQRRDTGEQGLKSVDYEDADDASLIWLAAAKLEEALDASADVHGYDEQDGIYTVTLTDAAIHAGEFDSEVSGDEAWDCARKVVKRLEGTLPENLPRNRHGRDLVHYDVELDDGERDIVRIRIRT